MTSWAAAKLELLPRQLLQQGLKREGADLGTAAKLHAATWEYDETAADLVGPTPCLKWTWPVLASARSCNHHESKQGLASALSFRYHESQQEKSTERVP